MDSIRERQKRYYKVFGIDIPKQSVGGGGWCIENVVRNKEAIIRKSIMNPGKLRSTISCDDRYDKSKLRKIIENNMNIAKRIIVNQP